jgi:hypothetical protein
MRIVQSFWSGKKNLIDNSFGWFTPQHHLMAWALSCLKLKEHYDDLHLYTDTNGYKVLVEYLNLPYKAVHICYDSIHYNENLWALPKIMTYATQEEPFIHVDGDVFIWEKFKSTLENAPLLAQNLEIGTIYYKTMMTCIRKELKCIPKFLDEELNKESIPSYNAGILGGNDIQFFKKYSKAALELINNNYNENEQAKVSINFNVLFEQILFYSLATRENKTVICYFEKKFKDNGYMKNDITDFTAIPHRLNYLHLIGPYKQDKETCEIMSRILFQQYPEYFLKIIALFKKQHIYFETKIATLFPNILANNIKNDKNSGAIKLQPYVRTQQAIALQKDNEQNLTYNKIKLAVKNSNSIIKALFKYETKLSKIIKGWEKISEKNFYALEYSSNNYFKFLYLSHEAQLETIIESNLFLEIINTSCNWTLDIQRNLSNEMSTGTFAARSVSIACIPELFFKGYTEIILDELNYNILTILKMPMPLRNLLKELECCFTIDEIKNDYDIIYELVLIKLKYLFHNKCIFIKPIDSNNVSSVN